ncbi:MAG TPA: hypothetical protein VFA72_23460 [Burkholderiales bacterium]|nr:hypothetical protein [Burkholderiales bacterium]
MPPIHARLHLSALLTALSVTFSIVWALSSYAYAPPATGAATTAKQIVPLRACS